MLKPTPLYQLTLKEDEALREHLKKAQPQGLIRQSHSPYGAPVLFLAKKERGLCTVTYYWALNAATVKNKYPLLLINYLFEDLAGAEFFINNDLTAGYNQTRVKDQDILNKAFFT